MWKMIKTSTSVVLCVSLALTFVSGCSVLHHDQEVSLSASFAQYRAQTEQYILAQRQFQQADRQAELQWNAPQEWRPSGLPSDEKPHKGILLVHGLGDSPWSFHDIAPRLANQGYLVRTVLLPGHGTKPDDLIDITAEEWLRVVYEQAKTLTDDVDGDMYLGGFSTGANLILDYAYTHPEIKGLALFSPGFKTSVPFGWLSPLLAPVKPWLMKPEEGTALQSPVRYLRVPTNGYAQYYRSSIMAQKRLETPYDKPVFMVLSEHDSVLDTEYLLTIFKSRFTHPKSQLIWYGDEIEQVKSQSRILVRSDRIPEQHISQFSHMGVLFDPTNPLYGNKGKLRMCMNSLNEEETQQCESSNEVWYSAWGYSEANKIHARLTFNPYLNWQTDIMTHVLSPEPNVADLHVNLGSYLQNRYSTRPNNNYF